MLRLPRRAKEITAFGDRVTRGGFMRLSTGRVSADGTMCWEDTGTEFHRTARARMTLAMAVALLVGCIGIVFGTTAKPAAAAGTDTPIQFASGQVFASIGNSQRGRLQPWKPLRGATRLTQSHGDAQRRSRGDLHRGERLRRQPATSTSRTTIWATSSSIRRPGAHMGVFASGLRTRCPWPSTPPATCTSASRGRTYHRRVQLDRGPGAQHRAGADREHRRPTGSTLCQPVHHRLHVGGTRHP